MRAFLTGALAALVIATAPAAAQACSIVPGPLPDRASDPRALLDDARTASFGVVTEVRSQRDPRQQTGPVDYVVRSDGAVLGDAPPTTRTVRVTYDLCDFRPTFEVGARVASVDDALLPAEALDRALVPYPRASGAGRAEAVLAGRFGDATVAALDRRGRVLAYGFGGPAPLAIEPCPGGERVVQAGSGATVVRRVRDLAIVRRLALGAALVRCLDARGTLVAALSGARGGIGLSEGTRLRRVGRGRVLALGDRAALLARGRRMVEQAYAGGRAVDAGPLPSRSAVAASPDLSRVLLQRVTDRGRATVTFRDRRSGLEVVRRLPPGDGGSSGPRPTTTLAFTPGGLPLIGFRDALRAFDARFARERRLGGGELFGRAGVAAWGMDFDGVLWRGRTRVLVPPRIDAGPLAALPRAVAIRAADRRPDVLARP